MIKKFNNAKTIMPKRSNVGAQATPVSKETILEVGPPAQPFQPPPILRVIKGPT